MSTLIARLVVYACAGVLATGAAAQDRQMLGRIALDIGDTSSRLEIFNGPVSGFQRALASYRPGVGDFGGSISIEGVAADVPPDADPMQGMVMMRMEFSGPGPLDATASPEGLSLSYVAQWRADEEMPRQFFNNVDDPEIAFDVLDLGEGNARTAGTVNATMCPHDFETDQTQAGSDDCVHLAMQFDTALLPWAPPVAVDTTTGPMAADDGPVTMDVLGSVTATLDGAEREWVTIAGQMRGEQGASANWQRMEITVPGFADSFGAMADNLSDEERAQMDMLDDLFSGSNPMAEMMEQLTGQPMGGNEHINLTISGHDPASPNILTEQVLALDVFLTSSTPPLGAAIPAEITYIVEASGGFIPAVFYTSGEDGLDASVTFDRLDLTPDEGHASGSFRAEMCRMEGARLTDGADPSDCMAVEGRFDTALIEEEAYRP